MFKFLFKTVYAQARGGGGRNLGPAPGGGTYTSGGNAIRTRGRTTGGTGGRTRGR